MHRLKAAIPHLFTLGNLALGCAAIKLSFEGHYTQAAYCVFIAAILDFFDGFLARLLKVHSELGKQLDSLADMVTFGIAPGFFIYKMMGCTCDLSYAFLFIPIFSAIRLAKFNIDTRQSTTFIGVPTPAVALTVACMLLIYVSKEQTILNNLLHNKESLAVISILLSILLVSPFEMLALKFKNYDFKSNWAKYILIICAILLIVLFKISGGVYLFIVYVLLSLIVNFVAPNNKEE